MSNDTLVPPPTELVPSFRLGNPGSATDNDVEVNVMFYMKFYSFDLVFNPLTLELKHDLGTGYICLLYLKLFVIA